MKKIVVLKMFTYKFLLFVVLFTVYGESVNLGNSYDTIENWTGKWFPYKPTEATLTKEQEPHTEGVVLRIPMGIKDPKCDDGQEHLEVDWLDGTDAYMCYEDRSLYTSSKQIRPIYEVQNIPPAYVAMHVCMNESITYDDSIPTFGEHRPLWPQWGEYTFVPKQRWLHNLEHGGIVMLYHPCASKQEVKKLRDLVTGCLYRHIITPYNLLTPERPLALVAWGKRIQMSAVSKKVVVQFIKEAALRGPEKIAKDGQYTHALIHHSKVVSTLTDDTLCPNY